MFTAIVLLFLLRCMPLPTRLGWVRGASQARTTFEEKHHAALGNEGSRVTRRRQRQRQDEQQPTRSEARGMRVWRPTKTDGGERERETEREERSVVEFVLRPGYHRQPTVPMKGKRKIIMDDDDEQQ
ncbi:uncharacterized protein PV09_02407 [Verruconis gallopava]|uniref:Secreted protein n=1 Tax=Verruconis gallopava TaxID=253628 RepID=A0A0D2AIJ2_9PEZI|nr:uncharacterized protein PV09_02407 [Verruconis gallopava]KIW06708.1 hypothetical protein PV09_02407 [Verruconis gallopava]